MAGIKSPMTSQPSGGGKMSASHHGRLALPVNNAALKQPQTPTAVGIQFRTGEVKPGSPGGSAKINSPMHTKPANKVP